VTILLVILSFVGAIPYGIIAYQKSKIKDGAYHCYRCDYVVGYRKDGVGINYGRFEGDIDLLNSVDHFDNVIQFSLERRKKK
jgi:hypothetical protein